MKDKKMTLKEYEKKYSKKENVKLAKSFIFLLSAAIGLIIFACLFFIVLRVYEINKYAGYVAIGVAVLIFILIYIVPLAKISTTKSFMVNVDSKNARAAQKYNRKLRKDIADKILDLKFNTEDSIYSDELIKELAFAKESNKDKELKDALTKIYSTDVKKASNKLIKEHAIKVGLSTALSQSERVDTLFVVAYNLSLIKDIIFLYGYRPSDAKMSKIYTTVIADALVAYGLGSSVGSVTNTITKLGGKALDKIPYVGGLVGTIVDSLTQGIINSTLTVMIGFQTKKYLKNEYKLQDILDEIDIASEEEEKEITDEVKSEVTSIAKSKKKSKDAEVQYA